MNVYYLVDRSNGNHPLDQHICHAHTETIRIRSNYVDTMGRWIQEHSRIYNEQTEYEKLDEMNKFWVAHHFVECYPRWNISRIHCRLGGLGACVCVFFFVIASLCGSEKKRIMDNH